MIIQNHCNFKKFNLFAQFKECFIHYSIQFLFLFLFIIPHSITNASVYLNNQKLKTIDTLPSITKNGKEYVSIIHFCKSLNINWDWDMYTESLVCSRNNSKVVFIQNNNFYKRDDSIFQLIYSPIRFKENLFLNTEGAVEIFSELVNIKINWVKEKKLLTLSMNKESVKGLNLEKELKSIDKKTIIIDKMDEIAKKTAFDSLLDNSLINSKDTIKTIVIDPGHGGKDPGAIGKNGIREKDVVLKIGLALRNALKANSSLRVYMTRSTDKFIPLRQRTKFANKMDADIFISIHANSIGGNKKKKALVKGYKIYFLSQAKNEDDKLTAMIENSVIELEDDTQKGDYLQNVLIDMANNEFLKESQDFSILLSESFESSLAKVTKLHRGIGQANFWVLNGAYMPAVLIETCFISNTNEEKLLANPKFQKKLGKSIANAVIKFKNKYEAEL